MMTTDKNGRVVRATAILVAMFLGRVSAGAQNSVNKLKPVPASTEPARESTKALQGANKGVSPEEQRDYRIGEQDVLMITVWKEPDLSGQVVVRPDGKITVPLLDEITVTGLTPGELQRTLSEKFQAYVAVPQVTVIVREIHSRTVYLIGQVAKEGVYQINKSTTVLQLIAEAGGLRDFANRKKIYVLRRENGKDVRYPFNYNEVVQGKTPERNILLRPGDTVVVP